MITVIYHLVIDNLLKLLYYDSMKKIFIRLIRPSARLFCIVAWVIVGIMFFRKDYEAAIVCAALLLVAILYASLYWRINRKRIRGELQHALFPNSEEARAAMRRLPIPVATFALADGHVLWCNDEFLHIADARETLFETLINDVVPDFERTWLLDGKDESPHPVVLNDKHYRVFGSAIRLDSDFESRDWAITYWSDITEYDRLKEDYGNSRLSVMIIVLDNYEEIFKNVTDTIKSTILAQIDSKINDWTKSSDGFLTRFDRDRYVFLFETRHLEQFVTNQFSLLDDVREVEGQTGSHPTISIGIGCGADSPQEGFQFATLAIEMALSRGGDQAVVKDRYNFEFHGGKNQAVERNTKVKSRTYAHALGEIIRDASSVIIMGHKAADFDAMGAAFGVNVICRKLGRKAYIVVNPETCLTMPLINKAMELPEYQGVFVSGQDALLVSDNKSLLVVVDTSRPDRVESRQLLDSLTRLVVFDHHRRAAQYIDDKVALNLLQPYSSSTCELVTDLLLYSTQSGDILKLEAEALLAGIILDSKNFAQKTGTRTFEAAAFLRKAGADTTEVNRFFQLDLASVSARAAIVQKSELYLDRFAIANAGATDDRIVTAQAADMLLNVTGVSASFVVSMNSEGLIHISARSQGDVNVQLVMEHLGGGGTENMAAAQFTDRELSEVMIDLRAAIYKMIP